MNVPTPARDGLRRLLLALLFSEFGFRIMVLAIPLIAVTELHATPLQISVIAACQTGAFLLVGLPSGAIVDRLRRRRVMVVSDLVRAAVLVTLPLMWLSGGMSVPYLCVASIALGVCTVFFDVANQTYLPRLVGPDQLVAANSRLVVIDSVAGTLGPGAGGLLIERLTAPFATVLGVAGWLWSALCVSRIRDDDPKPERRADTHLRRDIADGVRAIVTDPLLRPIALCSTTLTFFWAVAGTMLIVLMAGTLGATATTIGVVFAVGNAGGIAATLVVRRLIDRVGDGVAIRWSIAVCGPCTLLAPLAGPGWRVWLIAAASFALSAGLVVYNVAQVSYRQRTVPADLLGRVNATIRFFAWGARPLGALCGGLIAAVLGIRCAVWVGAAGTSLSALWLYLSPLRTLRHLPVPAGTP
ncbi:MFS transporter [Actinophytocola algeriensis]|uniref:MFS family permease n=1 Tax=Actinophytocola algeriensis TaxID=1768010 RepID=A0A7W7QG28_9PSEU|nr:MFS transporter [Actinophytocola algeriensis]MBB4912879.1 MFS family permease [Actinophytocola algeriensis]MBE1474076.1 MFS family permease [Actinophytocola algeriensis]